MSSVGGEWFSAGELAAKALPNLPSTKAGILKAAKAAGWDCRTGPQGPLARKRQGRGGGVEYHVSLLPEAARLRLVAADLPKAAERPDRETAWSRWELLPDSIRAEAQRRLAVIEKVEALTRQGLRKTAAIDQVVAQSVREAQLGGDPPISASTLHGWFARISGVDAADRAAYLAPEYGGRSAKSDLSDDAWEFYKGLYLQQSKLSHAACYRRLLRVAPENGWTVPSAKTLQRRMDNDVPPPVQTLWRYGPEALNHAFPHLTRDRSSITPMQVLNLDGHIWDVMVKWPNGTIARPVSLAVQDIASGKILAIRFDLSLNHHLVRLALGDTFRHHGLCQAIFMDNGRENAAQAIAGGQHRLRWGKTPEEEPAGLLTTLGIKATFVTPYWGQAKPIERAFRNFAHDIAKGPEFVGAYTGHNTVSKPENYGSRAVPFAEFEAIVRRELAYYNAQEGRRGQGMNGRSFDQVFAEGIAKAPPRTATEAQLRLCMLASKPVAMEAKTGAVTVEGHRYWSPELGAVPAQRVVVRFDPEQMELPAFVYSVSGKFLAEATRIQAGNFDSLSDGREHRKNQRDYTRAVKAAAKAARKLDARDVAAQLAMPAAPEPIQTIPSNVVRPAFKAPRKVADLGGAQPDHLDAWGRGIRQALGGE